jgi:undecaprenyl-diphosphatase
MSINLAELWRVIVLGIVEGITEFLPISSTGHLIVFADFLKFEGSVGGTFEIFIQLGAVLAVVWFYRRDVWQQVRAVPSDRSVQRFWVNLAIAFLPAALVGLVLHDWIKEHLFRSEAVALAMIVGGIVLLLVDRREHAGGTQALYDVSPKQALGVGLAQVFSLFPGASRSATSIIGGLLAGLDRPTATGFSFYLAIPTLGLATVYELVTSLDQITRSDVVNLILGAVVSFVVSLVVIGWLLRYVAHHDFKPFGVYRIIAGLVVLSWALWLS